MHLISLPNQLAMSSEAIDTTSDLSKVDSAISGLSSSPTAEKKIGHRRTSSSASGVFNIADLGKCPQLVSSPRGTWGMLNRWVEEANQGAESEGKELEIAKETQKLNWSVLLLLTLQIACSMSLPAAGNAC